MHEPYAYFEHGADMGIVGRGESIEQAFEHAATAVFAMMADPARVRPLTSVAIEFAEADVELALVTWLNLLLGEARSRALIFGRFQLHRDRASPEGTSSAANWTGTAAGEPWHDGIERGVEVKGATLTGLAVTRQDGMWDARCVVDV